MEDNECPSCGKWTGEKPCACTAEEILDGRFRLAAMPLMRFLANTYHPHMTAIVTNTDAELCEGKTAFQTDEFVKD